MSEITDLLKANFKGKTFKSADMRMAGRILKKSGAQAVIKYLSDKGAVDPPDFRPPAKCNIIAQSRPFDEWPICKASMAIQQHIYGLTKNEFDESSPGTSSASHEQWFAKTGVDTHGFTHVQGLNLIFQHAKKRYEGVIKKVENYNEKERKKFEGINERRSKEGMPLLEPRLRTAFGDDGKFAEKPGVNPSIYLYQQTSPRPYDKTKHPYVHAPFELKEITTIPTQDDRLKIPFGAPGHVPEKHRSQLSMAKHKRRRAWYALSQNKPRPPKDGSKGRRSVRDLADLKAASLADAIPLVSRVGFDWVVIDGRGLLRNLRWRKLAHEGMTVEEMLGFFSGDPVIDPRRNVATFIYKAEHATVKSRKPIGGAKRAREELLKATASSDGVIRQVGLISVDLGQTNPVAYEISRMHQANGELVAEHLEYGLLNDEQVNSIQRYRAAWDSMNESFRQKAIESLSMEAQDEIMQASTGAAKRTREAVLTMFGPNATLPWSRMSSNTTCISDALIEVGKEEETNFVTSNGPRKRTDAQWAAYLRPRVNPETRALLNQAVWDLMKRSDEYERLSKRKLEMARQCVNFVVARAEKLTQCNNIGIVLENLVVRNFHGSGRRESGWEGFFEPKRENRWFMQVLHKAFSDLAQHRGVMVFEVHPAYSSQTCPACRYVDPKNRSSEDRERFKCLKCGRSFNADREVATFNIREIARTGVGLPKPDCERSRDVQTPGTARKSGRSLKSNKNPSEPKHVLRSKTRSNITSTLSQNEPLATDQKTAPKTGP